LGALWGALVGLMRSGMLFLSHATGSYGLGIILLTILIRVILFPLYKAQIDSMKRLQELQPEMARLQQRYKDDRQRLAEEQLRLYREHGINPMSGCWPMLLQLPVIYALYGMLRNFQYESGGLSPQFLWLPDLAKPDPWHVMPVLGGLSTYWQSKISMNLQPGAQQQQMQAMLYMMPLMMLYIFWGLPAGLAIYWVVANLITIAQQYVTLGAWRPGRRDDGGSGGQGTQRR
jgi:YidC/Oxa1 family membrane protein insertase